MKRTYGFTLIEMLLSMALLGILMLAFMQLFGSSLRASGEINARNELLNEGQIAQQLINSKLQNAFYIYSGTAPDPNPMALSGSSGTTARNTVRSGAGQNWIPNTDPFIAMLLPPSVMGQCPGGSVTGNANACFTFYAYYPMRRDTFISLNTETAPTADPNNANAWILMEYRANILDGVNRSSNLLLTPPLPGTASGAAYTGRVARMLVDFVQPTGTAPTYQMFTVCAPRSSVAAPCPTGTTTTSPNQVNVKLRLLENRAGEEIRVPAGSAPFTTPTPTLSTRVYPRNWN